jgi:cysteine desulfurase/selenocysteine lyase
MNDSATFRDPEYWLKIRGDFPILGTALEGGPLVYLDSAASAQMPKQVLEAIVGYQTSLHSNVHRGVHTLSQRATDAFEEARSKAARFINARKPEECIFVRGATEGINLVAQSWGRKFLKTGDEIILTSMEHHSNIVPWQLLGENLGLVIKVVPVRANGTLDLEVFQSLLTEKTKLVGCIHVSNVLGTVNPVAEIIRAAHSVGAVTVIDGCQAAAHIPVDVQALEADFYTFSAHKMYGPSGVGILYGREELLNEMPPFQGGGEMIESVSFEKTTFKTPPYRFEAGTPAIMPAIGLGAAVDYLSEIGFNKITEHERALTSYAIAELHKIPSIKVIESGPERTGVISFLMEGIHPHDVGSILDQCGVAVRVGQHCAEPLMQQLGLSGTVRASIGLYTDAADIEALIRGLGTVLELFG